MTAQEIYDRWKDMGALVRCRHDFKKSGLTFSAVFAPDMVSEAARALHNAGYFLEDISVMKVREGFLATYHYDSARKPGRLAVRALAKDGVFVSVNSVYQGAEWHEREAADFFGVNFIGNPNLVPLLLPHDFPETPPLIKPDNELAAMIDLKLFGETPEIIDPSWTALAAPPQAAKEEGAA